MFYLCHVNLQPLFVLGIDIPFHVLFFQFRANDWEIRRFSLLLEISFSFTSTIQTSMLKISIRSRELVCPVANMWSYINIWSVLVRPTNKYSFFSLS